LREKQGDRVVTRFLAVMKYNVNIIQSNMELNAAVNTIFHNAVLINVIIMLVLLISLKR